MVPRDAHAHSIPPTTGGGGQSQRIWTECVFSGEFELSVSGRASLKEFELSVSGRLSSNPLPPLKKVEHPLFQYINILLEYLQLTVILL